MAKILVDADSLPLRQREILIRRITKDNICAVFAADRRIKDIDIAIEKHTHALRSEASKNICDESQIRKIRSTMRFIQVAVKEGSADDVLVSLAESQDIAITHDIPLASRLIEKGVLVLDDRGGVYDKNNIKERLSLRNAMCQMREWGIQAEKTKGFDSKTVENFANALDKALLCFSK